MHPAPDALARARMQLVEAGRAMRAARLVVSREGNLSVRVGEEHVLVTPAGADKGALHPEDLVLTLLDGTVVGEGRASVESPMHLEIYRRRPDVRAVAHGHPVYATAFAVAGRPLDACLLPEVILTIGCVPLAPYATPSTDELAASVGPVAAGHDAFLLENHGAVAVGMSPGEAVERLEIVERLAEITWLAETLGGACPLSRDQVERLAALGGDRASTRPWPPCRTSDD